MELFSFLFFFFEFCSYLFESNSTSVLLGNKQLVCLKSCFKMTRVASLALPSGGHHGLRGAVWGCNDSWQEAKLEREDGVFGSVERLWQGGCQLRARVAPGELGGVPGPGREVGRRVPWWGQAARESELVNLALHMFEHGFHALRRAPYLLEHLTIPLVGLLQLQPHVAAHKGLGFLQHDGVARGELLDAKHDFLAEGPRPEHLWDQPFAARLLCR